MENPPFMIFIDFLIQNSILNEMFKHATFDDIGG